MNIATGPFEIKGSHLNSWINVVPFGGEKIVASFRESSDAIFFIGAIETLHCFEEISRICKINGETEKINEAILNAKVNMRQVHKEIGKLVKKARLNKDMTQLQLAEKLGYDSTQFVSLMERALSKVPAETLGKLITILEIPERKVRDLLVDDFHKELSEQIRIGKGL